MFLHVHFNIAEDISPLPWSLYPWMIYSTWRIVSVLMKTLYYVGLFLYMYIMNK